MKINYEKYITFFLIFMIIEHILLITEWHYCLDMISYIQGYKFNFYKNSENEFKIITPLTLTGGYVILLLFIFYYIENIFDINFKNFLFIVFLYFLWDFAYLCFFDKAIKYLPVLLYDIFVVGGVCLLLTQYLLNNYYDILKNYTLLLFIFYFITMILFLYECYKYNPDLSNIKGISLF